jgi:hypothetical protein
MPDTAEYLVRIREFAAGQDPLTSQSETAGVLSRLIENASTERLTMRPRKDKWSVAEILAHLAEDEIATAWRYRQMVEHSASELPGFNQDLWAQLGDYAARPAQESLELFRLLRVANVQFLRKLSAEQWECFGIHAERGRITVRDLAAHMVGNDANHVEQVRNLIR